MSNTSIEKVEKGLVPVLQTAAREAKPMDLQDVMQRFTLDATCTLVCGEDPGCLSTRLPMVPIARAMDETNEVVLLRHTVPKFWWKLLNRLNMGMEKKLTHAWEVVDWQILARREELQRRTPPPKKEEEEEEAIDLLTIYMQYENEEEEMAHLKSPKTFLRDTTISMLTARRDTTSAALTRFSSGALKEPNCRRQNLTGTN